MPDLTALVKEIDALADKASVAPYGIDSHGIAYDRYGWIVEPTDWCRARDYYRPNMELMIALRNAWPTIRQALEGGRVDRDGAWDRFLENIRVMDGLDSTRMNFLGDATRYRDAFERALKNGAAGGAT